MVRTSLRSCARLKDSCQARRSGYQGSAWGGSSGSPSTCARHCPAPYSCRLSRHSSDVNALCTHCGRENCTGLQRQRAHALWTENCLGLQRH